MTILRWIPMGIFALAVACLPACVELCGQRISWFYDKAGDELRILIFYDGIHTSKGDGQTEAATQLPEFVKNGDVLLMDGPAHFTLGEMRAEGAKHDAGPGEKLLAEAIQAVTVESIGHYREPDGRIGAAQAITIKNPAQFLTRINALINSEIAQEHRPDDPMEAAIADAAAKGHAWLTLDGNALTITVPIDPAGWAKVKGGFLRSLAQGTVVEASPDYHQPYGVRLLFQAIASSAVSYQETIDRAVFTIGLPERPNTIRLPLRDRYERSLEKLVVENVETYLDERMAAHLLGHEPASPALSDILAWGPPEQQVSALIAYAQGSDAEGKKSAAVALKAWGTTWNEGKHLPAAPQTIDDPGVTLHVFKLWYAGFKGYPLAGGE